MTPTEIILILNALFDLAVRLAQGLPSDDALRVEVEAIAARVRGYKPIDTSESSTA